MNILSSVKNFTSRLTKIGNKEPLHFLSLSLIIALDIFVLVNIFQGMYLQTKQLDTPRDVIPYACENFLIQESDEASQREEKISILRSAVNKNSYFYDVHNKYASGVDIIENNNKNTVDIRCRALYSKALTLNENSDLVTYFNNIDDYNSSIYDYKRSISNLEKQYDTMLLEKIANQQEKYSITEKSAETVKEEIVKNEREISILRTKITNTENEILLHADSQSFLFEISQNQPEIEKTLSNLQFWCPLKEIAYQLVFLLPLFLFFLWLYRKTIQANNSILSLIASHLLLVTLIPIVLKFFELLLDILPFHFLSDVLEILEALNLVALFNYILIIIGIFVIVAFIYFLQKKVFSAQKIWEKRIEKRKCWNCGVQKMSQLEKCCSLCGEVQLEKCEHCGGEKYVKAPFCKDCGK